MIYRQLGNTGFRVSAIGYGGIVSAQHFDTAFIPGDGQKMSDDYVSWALDQGINYFDVAPSYGDAQLLMGNSLKKSRSRVYLACKTNQRKKADAEQEMYESLKQLHTDYFDVYQLHGLSTMDEIETCFGPGGAIELLREMKEKGIARRVGFTAHSEAVALRALELFDFDTVMFPFNWHMHMVHGMGETLRTVVKQKGLGLLGIKSMVECAWSEDERSSSDYPKSWCRPFDVRTESSLLLAALRYAATLGSDVLIPPGNFSHFSFAAEHIDEIFNRPLSEEDRVLLEECASRVSSRPFFGEDCYQL